MKYLRPLAGVLLALAVGLLPVRALAEDSGPETAAAASGAGQTAPAGPVAAVSAGTQYAAAVMADGSLWTWGRNQYGYLGTGSLEDAEFPAKALEGISSVSTGWRHAAAVGTDGSLWTWGSNQDGQLGFSSDEWVFPEPRRVLEGMSAASAGWDHTAAVGADGSLWAWGSNAMGQLGDGGTEASAVPVKVMDGVAAVSAANSFTAALGTDGSLWTWGSNQYGQLGNGGAGNATAETVVPVDDAFGGFRLGQVAIQTVPVKVLDGVAAVSAGSRSMAAIKTDGSLWTWGFNVSGQLGNGGTEASAVPVKIMDGAAAVSMGSGHAAAIKTDGSLWTWGENGSGQLGNGGTEASAVPVKIMDGVASVSAGSGFTAAIKTDGSLWTWGENNHWELGNRAMTEVNPMYAPPAHRYSAAPAQVIAGKPSAAPTEVTLPDAVKYVPYVYDLRDLPDVPPDAVFRLSAGAYPAGNPVGFGQGSVGRLQFIPTELGVFQFTISAASQGAVREYNCTLSVLWQGGVDVERYNEAGYGFVETAVGDGRVPDLRVPSPEALTDQTVHCEPLSGYSHALYLDGAQVTGYTRTAVSAEDGGGSRITIPAKALGALGNGTHVLTLAWHITGEADMHYTCQTFTITGIPGSQIQVTVDGKPIVWTDAEPFINSDNRTMTPFRIIGEALGLEVRWDGEKREAVFTDGARTIFFPIDATDAYSSAGDTVSMDTAAVIVNGRTYAPVRFLAEFFGHSVGWEEASQTVVIT